MSPPTPISPLGLGWRPLTLQDAPSLHALIRASEQHDHVPFATSLDEVRNELEDPEVDLPSDSIAGFEADGTLACFGAIRMRGQVTRRRAIQQNGTVRPDLRRRGLGTLLMDWTEARAGERLAAVSDDLPSFLEAWSESTWADRRALFEGRGYEPIRYYDDMRRPLSEPIPDAPLPAGLRFERWTPELDDALREAHNEAFHDHWGSEPLTAEAWRHQLSGSPMFRPALTFGVMDGDQVAGYCMAYHSPEDALVTGRLEGWLGQIGVRRPWRGRGVASSVMCHVMREMAAAGLEYACLDVDSENPSGAVGLYTRLGFEKVERFIRWAKPA